MMISFSAIFDDVLNKTVTFQQIFHAGKLMRRVRKVIAAGEIDARYFQSLVFEGNDIGNQSIGLAVSEFIGSGV